MPLNNEIVNKEMEREILKKCMETNENKNTMFQNLWDTTKVIPCREFIAIQA